MLLVNRRTLAPSASMTNTSQLSTPSPRLTPLEQNISLEPSGDQTEHSPGTPSRRPPPPRRGELSLAGAVDVDDEDVGGIHARRRVAPRGTERDPLAVGRPGGAVVDPLAGVRQLAAMGSVGLHDPQIALDGGADDPTREAGRRRDLPLL